MNSATMNDVPDDHITINAMGIPIHTYWADEEHRKEVVATILGPPFGVSCDVAGELLLACRLAAHEERARTARDPYAFRVSWDGALYMRSYSDGEETLVATLKLWPKPERVLPKIHPRHDSVEKARRDLETELARIEGHYDLTSAEWFEVMTCALHRRAALLVRTERKTE